MIFFNRDLFSIMCQYINSSKQIIVVNFKYFRLLQNLTNYQTKMLLEFYARITSTLSDFTWECIALGKDINETFDFRTYRVRLPSTYKL